MENTSNVMGIEGIWRSEPLPDRDRPQPREEDSNWAQRIAFGFTFDRQSESEGLPPIARTEWR